MADYKQEEITGSAWQRAHRIVLDNPIGQLPVATFFEQQAINIGGEIITREAGALFSQFDPVATFAVLDESLQPTGQTMTQADLLVAMRSLYIHLAQQRDAEHAARQLAEEQANAQGG